MKRLQLLLTDSPCARNFEGQLVNEEVGSSTTPLNRVTSNDPSLFSFLDLIISIVNTIPNHSSRGS